MPTYRYRCEECGDEFELWQSITAEPLRTHDHGCGGGLVKVMTPAGIVLKGSGFYKTDSRSGSKRGDGEKADQPGEKRGGGDTGEPKGDRGGSTDASKPAPTPSSTSSSGGQSPTGAATS